jgi:2-polyprenyl-6-methoxyphenol hydroxylase-like FAD-dependent oxidoreductase
MTERAIVAGAGPIGLATAVLLATDGYEVIVLEKDPDGAPAGAEKACRNWRRRGVPQFSGAHYMHARFRQLLDAELPAVRDRIEELGGRWFNPISALPGSLPDRSARPGDERFQTITARRPVLEAALAQVAEDTVRVKILRGVGVEQLVTGPSAQAGIPHVTGVRTTHGDELSAALVVDAMGRRSKLAEWVAAAGGRPPYEAASDAGFAYYTRHYRARDGQLPEFRGPLAADIATLRVLTLPADNHTWSLALVPMAGDTPFKALRDNRAWERAFAAVPHAAHWLDAEPVSDVLAMAGVLDRYRRLVVEGRPVVTGVLPVGDSWACTNPTAGRGMSLGLTHAVVVRDALRSCPDDPVGLVETFDRATEQTLTPWYRDQFDRDQHRAARNRAVIEGREPDPAVEDPALLLMMGAAADPEVARGYLDTVACLALPSEVLDRPGMRARLTSIAAETSPAALPGPTRQQLVDLLQ